MNPLWFVLLLIHYSSCLPHDRAASCQDAEENCSDLVAFIDICNTRPQAGAFICAKTCNMCGADPGSVTNPTVTFPHQHHTVATVDNQQTTTGHHNQNHHTNSHTNHHHTNQPHSSTTAPSGTGSISCTRHRDAAVTIPDTGHRTCYYLYDHGMRYTAAKKKCESGGTHMVHLETNEEENRLAMLMSGLNHADQFWLGMENVNGQWMWTGNGQQTPVQNDLWEGSHVANGNNKYAYNTPPNHWKAGSHGMEYRVLCEENM